MNYIDEVLDELSSRLPELEWKISKLGSSFSTKNLPKGLFQNREYTAELCIKELKADINNLAGQKSSRSSLYLAHRLREKINVLVTLCQLHDKKNPEESRAFNLHALSTRQQRLNAMEHDIKTLEMQQIAIAKALEQISLHGNTAAILKAQSELGAVEKKLTMAKEAYQRAIS